MGTRQRPVNLPPSDNLEPRSPLTVPSEHFTAQAIETGRAVEWTIADRMTMTFDFPDHYKHIKMIMHLKSEHTVDSNQAAVELQFYHVNQNGETLVKCIPFQRVFTSVSS